MNRHVLIPVCAVLMALVASSVHAELIDGLKAYYTFDTSAADELGNYDGTVVGATHTSSGKIGSAYEFTGSNYISVGTPLPVGNSARAFSMWIKPTSDDPTGLYASGMESYASAFNVWFEPRPYGFGDGDDFIYIQRYYDDVETERTLSIEKDAWHHVVISYDGTTSHQVKFYLDGNLLTLDEDYSLDLTFNTASTSQSIGGGYMPSNSVIDEVGIWDRSLTTEEVAALYNNGRGTQLTQAVPEPASWMLLSGSVILGFVGSRCRRKKPV